MLRKIREFWHRHQRRALVAELENMAQSRAYMDWRERQIVKQIQALDLKTTRNLIAAVRVRGY